LFLSFPLAIVTMYFMGINGCNPYTNWYGVYLVAILYVVLYEITLWADVHPNLLYSLTNLVENLPSTLLVDLAYPFL
jgi:hypothetical protein